MSQSQAEESCQSFLLEAPWPQAAGRTAPCDPLVAGKPKTQGRVQGCVNKNKTGLQRTVKGVLDGCSECANEQIWTMDREGLYVDIFGDPDGSRSFFVPAKYPRAPD